MTQPTSVDMTFDTSLVDLNTSFSTTESDPSDSGLTKAYAHTMKTPTLQPASLVYDSNQETPKATQTAGHSSSQALSPGPASELPRSVTPIKHIPTVEAYDQWASIYDSDGNMLQAIDDDELSTLLPHLAYKILTKSSASSPAIDLIDLGCGTGRNTLKLITYPWPKTHKINITALDFSAGMLDVAARKIDALPLNPPEYANPITRLEQCDCFPTVSNPKASPMPSVSNLQPVDAIISTLVLEHIPLTDYFSTLAYLLVKGGYALVTNMHSEMGKISQAGFINEAGVKVRGQSFAHTPEETKEEARRAGFEVFDLRERRVEKADLEKGIVGERGGKWVGISVWYGLLLRKVV